MKKVAIIGLRRIGDAIYTLPIFEAYFKSNATVDIYTPSQVTGIYVGNENINKIYSFSPKEFWFGCLKALKQGGYDECILLHNAFKYALLPFLAKIPSRVGFEKELRSFLLTKHGSLPIKTVSSIEHNAMIMDLVGLNIRKISPKIYLTEQDEMSAEKSLTALGLQNKTTICFIVGSIAESRRWFVESFAELIDLITNKHKFNCLILGAPSDVEIADKVMALIQDKTLVHNLAGQTSLRETMQIFSKSSVVISNDTGPMHVASALGCQVITWVGLTTKLGVLPVSNNVTVLNSMKPCQDCLDKQTSIEGLGCLHKITPSLVLEALENVLKETTKS